MRLYKLTDQYGQTCGCTQWGEGIEHTALGGGPLCSWHWLHAYKTPLLAVLMSPCHGSFRSPRLWEADGEVGIEDGAKAGCTKLKTIRELPLPGITVEQRTCFAILCVKAVYQNAKWNMWADKWLSSEDRSVAAAYAARVAAAADAVAATAHNTVTHAAYAAVAAAVAAHDAAATVVAAAVAAAYATACAATVDVSLDLATLAEEAVRR